jgi:hypothetical protein
MLLAERARLAMVDPMSGHLKFEPAIAARRAGAALPIEGGWLGAVGGRSCFGHQVSLNTA